MSLAADASTLAAHFAELGGDSGPAYERVKNLVLAEISYGRWSEGDQLPSENQLVSALNLSRMTINRALRELTSEGRLTRIAGVGTFVAATKVTSQLFEVKNIADEIDSRGHRHSTEVVYVREEAVDRRQSFFGEAMGDRVYHSLLVHYEDDSPVQVEERFVNPKQAPDYLAQDFTRITPNTYLTQLAPLVRGEHIVEAVLASPEESQLLRIEPTQPCLLIRRRTWSKSDLVTAARLIHPGSRTRLECTFTG